MDPLPGAFAVAVVLYVPLAVTALFVLARNAIRFSRALRQFERVMTRFVDDLGCWFPTFTRDRKILHEGFEAVVSEFVATAVAIGRVHFHGDCYGLARELNDRNPTLVAQLRDQLAKIVHVIRFSDSASARVSFLDPNLPIIRAIAELSWDWGWKRGIWQGSPESYADLESMREDLARVERMRRLLYSMGQLPSI